MPSKPREASKGPGGTWMALVECPECKRQVSTAAAACPGCGFPVRNTSASAAETATAPPAPGAAAVPPDAAAPSPRRPRAIHRVLGVIAVLIATATAVALYQTSWVEHGAESGGSYTTEEFGLRSSQICSQLIESTEKECERTGYADLVPSLQPHDLQVAGMAALIAGLLAFVALLTFAVISVLRGIPGAVPLLPLLAGATLLITIAIFNETAKNMWELPPNVSAGFAMHLAIAAGVSAILVAVVAWGAVTRPSDTSGVKVRVGAQPGSDQAKGAPQTQPPSSP